MKKHLFILVLLLTLLSPPVLAQIAFLSSDLDRDAVAAGGKINVEFTVTNRGKNVVSNITVNFKIIREIDGGIISSESEGTALAEREVKDLEKELSIPQSAISGEYIVLIDLCSASGIPLASTYHNLVVEGESEKGVVFGVEGVFLTIPITTHKDENLIRKIYIDSYGTEGHNIPRNEPFYIKFNLRNLGAAASKLNADISIVSTYSPDLVVGSFQKDLETINSGGDGAYSFETQIDRPGTYRVVVDLYSNNEKIVQKECRAVIVGEGGSIIAVENAQDTYEQGEQVEITVDVVGRADGISDVNNASLEMNLIKDGKNIKTLTHEIEELPFNPLNLHFKFEAPEDLVNYVVCLKLGKGDKIFDSVNVSYEPLEPEKILTDDGRIMPLNKPGCFDDGVCTLPEYEYGNCLDCRGVTEPPLITTTSAAATSILTTTPLTTSLITTTTEDGGGLDPLSNLWPAIILIILILLIFAVLKARKK